MATYQISKIVTPSGDVCEIKNAITGVKGNAENSYRTGDVNLTPENIGAVGKNDVATLTEAKSYLGIS